MRRKRRKNNSGAKFYMFMSAFCLIVLFLGYNYIYKLSEIRKLNQDVTTISINYNNEDKEKNTGIFKKIMSYFNIFFEETFKENDEDVFIEYDTRAKNDFFVTIGSDDENSESVQGESFNIYENHNIDSTQEEEAIYIAEMSKKDNFFKVIESPSSRSSVPRNPLDEAISINENMNIIFYHTHATEAYKPNAPSNYRTTEIDYNVVGIGEKIAENLRNEGINITHLTNLFDHPDYNVSYGNSNKGVKPLLSNSKKNVIVDIHRDGADPGTAYEKFLSQVKTVTINGKKAASCTLVVGNKNGNAEELKSLAQTMFEIADEKYPGLFRKIIVRDGAYFNQYLSDYALLVEIGCSLNEIEEVNYSAELISDVFSEFLVEINK